MRILSKFVNKCSSGGSEHTLNGHRFASEIHMVHYNKKYGTLANAVLKADGKYFQAMVAS